jgi:hypothetical protein
VSADADAIGVEEVVSVSLPQAANERVSAAAAAKPRTARRPGELRNIVKLLACEGGYATPR